MAKIINPSQQMQTRAVNPKTSYSRIVSLSLALEPDSTWYYVVTPRVGQDVWLLGVRIWFRQKAIDRRMFTRFEVVTGTGPGISLAEVQDWERVLPVWQQSRQPYYWIFSDGREPMEWRMQQRWTTEGRRFGLLGMRDAETADDMSISFEISEG